MSQRLVRLVTVALVPSLLACGTNPKKQLQGKWEGERAENFSSAEGERATGWASGTSFEFRGSKVTVGIPAEAPRDGRFEVVEESEGALTLAFTRSDGVRDSADFRLEKDGRLRWQLGDGRSIVLRKVND